MVKLRLKRMGKTKQPFYRIVAIDSRVKRDGQYIELIGTYNPLDASININKEIALKWLTTGAQPTDTVRSLFAKAKIMQAFHEQKQENKKMLKKVEPVAITDSKNNNTAKEEEKVTLDKAKSE